MKNDTLLNYFYELEDKSTFSHSEDVLRRKLFSDGIDRYFTA